MSFLDIARIVAILAFGVVSFWVIYQLIKSADANENSDEEKENE